MRHFTIEKSYEINDVNFDCDPYEVRLLDENNEVITKGDWYHDKIDAELEGFFKCLEFLDIEYESTTRKINEDW